jgi:hypothetical protein
MVKEARMDAVKWVGISFAIAGLAMLAGAGATYMSSRNFLNISSAAEGVVTDLVLSHSSSSRSGVYHPKVSFQTEAGENIEFNSSFGSNPPSYNKGDRVKVLYDPANPNHASINSFFSLWFAPLLLSGMGILFAGIGSALLVALMRKARLRC